MRKSIRVIILTLVFVVAAFFIFGAGNNITGMPAVAQDSVGKHPYISLLVLGFVYVLLLSLEFHVHTARGKLTHEIEEELDKFKVGKQYEKDRIALKKYVDYSLSQGRKEADVEDILSEQGWDKGLIENVIEGYKKKTKQFS